MNGTERLDYVKKELEAIYEDLDSNVNQQILIRHFLKSLLEVTKGAEPTQALIKIKNKDL